MRQVQGNIEDFITLVRRRPALYNFTLDEFNDKELTEKLWKEVAREFNTNVDYCKTKWSVLRVSFARQMRNEKTNAKRSSETLINDWYLKDNMCFMRNYMRRRKNRKSSGIYYIENYRNDSLSKSTCKVKTESNLFNPSLQIKNEPVIEDENESVASLEIFADEVVLGENRAMSDFVTSASSSPLSNSESSKIENEIKDTIAFSGSSQKRKAIEQEDQEVLFSKKRTDREYEPVLKKEADKAEDSSVLKDDVSMTFFKSILPDFNKLTGRRQRLLKQKFILELNILLDEQEVE